MNFREMKGKACFDSENDASLPNISQNHYQYIAIQINIVIELTVTVTDLKITTVMTVQRIGPVHSFQCFLFGTKCLFRILGCMKIPENSGVFYSQFIPEKKHKIYGVGQNELKKDIFSLWKSTSYCGSTYEIIANF